MTFYAIWYDLRNLKNMKNIHGGVFLLSLQRFLNCTNGTKIAQSASFEQNDTPELKFFVNKNFVYDG